MLGSTDKIGKQMVKNTMALKRMCLQDVKERDNKKLRLDLHNHLPSTVDDAHARPVVCCGTHHCVHTLACHSSVTNQYEVDVES